MSALRWLLIAGAMIVLGLTPGALAQQNSPRIGYVFPAGGRQGSTFQVAVGGQFLDNVAAVRVSGTGVLAKVIEHTKPLTPAQFSLLRDRLKELLDKRTAAQRPAPTGATRPSTRPVWTADDEKNLADVRKKLANPPQRQGSPAIAKTVTVQVTISATAGPGQRKLRLAGSSGTSNPLVFCIGQLPEFSENEAKNSSAPTETAISIPAVVNGQIMPGNVDRYRFKAAKGQRLAVAVSARSLIPYLADAVPGWFQAVVAVHDAKGNEVAYADGFRFNPDPVLCCQIPADGDYVVQISDSIYRGREDFVYRIAIGELPYVTSIFPLGSRIGQQTMIQTTGWNLPPTTLTYDSRGRSPGVDYLTVRNGEMSSNRMPFAVDTLPEVLEKEPNNLRDNAQPVSPGVIVNGRIDQPGDWDVFRFEGHAGDQIVAEVLARRLASPLDSLLKLTDSAGQQLAISDDQEDKASGLNTHHADSLIRTKLPADGTYYLHLGDTQHKGAPEYAYRLRISAPRPDFELRIVPSSVNLRSGGAAAVTVYAIRRDGFSGEIALSLKGDPQGFTLGGGRLPANQDQVRLTLSAPRSSTDAPVSLAVEGRAVILGRETVRPALPADDMMQAFSYRHLVLAKELLVTAAGRQMPGGNVRILSPTPVTIPVGSTARVRVLLPAYSAVGRLQFELSDPPEGLSIRSVSAAREGIDMVLQSDAAKMKAGLKGNLIVTASVERPSSATTRPQTNRPRVPVAILPAIPFDIVP